ncbi:MAG: META domain-containing protein [Gammaproteobacteria bacterium]|nr:META domain-containing protein [Gammaproteobacteria bacterium]
MSATPLRRTAAALALFGLVSPSTVVAASLQGSEWIPLRIGDDALPPDTAAFVQFHSKGRLLGHGGCNRLFADYDAHDGRIFVGPVAATRMACTASVMAREAALAGALENARTYRRDGIQLVLFDAAQVPILELRQTDWDRGRGHRSPRRRVTILWQSCRPPRICLCRHATARVPRPTTR